MAVVPCNPPVLAVTCTTKLSLFSLDGTALPPVMEPSTSPNDPSVRSGAFGTFCRSDEGRADSIENMGGKVAEAHERDIRCIATSPAGDMVATGCEGFLECNCRRTIDMFWMSPLS